MLNEIKEYREYIKMGKKGSPAPRLMPQKLEDGLSGLVRAFETIARYQLFNQKHYDECDDAGKEQAINDTIEFLGKWFRNNLRRAYLVSEWYNKKLAESQNSEKKLPPKEWAQLSKNKEKQFENPIFPPDFEKRVGARSNSFKDLTYEKTIANALLRGPLVEYVLECDNDWLKDIYIENNDKKIPLLELSNKIKPKEIDRILKAISTYLLTQRLDKLCTNIDNEYLAYSKIDLANWIQETTIADHAYFNDKYFTKDGKPIIETIGVKNTSKLKVNNEFLKKYKFKIIPLAELDEAGLRKNGLVYYEDEGSTSNLMQKQA